MTITPFFPEGVLDNIEAWRAGTEKLDVAALYGALEAEFGRQSPTNYAALLVDALGKVTEPWRVS